MENCNTKRTFPVDSSSRLEKTLGQAGEIEPETEGILLEYEVDFSEFSDEVLDCLPKNLPWTIPAEEISKRRDLRWDSLRGGTTDILVLQSLNTLVFFYAGKNASSQSILLQPEIWMMLFPANSSLTVTHQNVSFIMTDVEKPGVDTRCFYHR